MRRSASAVSFFKASEAINRRRCHRDDQELRRKEPAPKALAPEPQPAAIEAPRPRRSFAEQFGYGRLVHLGAAWL